LPEPAPAVLAPGVVLPAVALRSSTGAADCVVGCDWHPARSATNAAATMRRFMLSSWLL
jgi:hypothetical protein